MTHSHPAAPSDDARLSSTTPLAENTSGEGVRSSAAAAILSRGARFVPPTGAAHAAVVAERDRYTRNRWLLSALPIVVVPAALIALGLAIVNTFETTTTTRVVIAVVGLTIGAGVRRIAQTYVEKKATPTFEQLAPRLVARRWPDLPAAFLLWEPANAAGLAGKVADTIDHDTVTAEIVQKLMAGGFCGNIAEIIDTARDLAEQH